MGNVVPDPPLDSWYVQGPLSMMNQLEADNKYVVTQPVEPVPGV